MMNVNDNAMSQARYWMLTVPAQQWIQPSPLPREVRYVKGQLERGNEGNYEHYQVIVVFSTKVRLRKVRELFGNVHAEPTRSAAAVSYVWKEDTYVPGTRFELGQLPTNRGQKRDWDRVWNHAREGKFDDIDRDILVRYYGNIKKIYYDHMRPVGLEKNCLVFWGRTGTGKSKRAWEEAGIDAYPKDPNSKWWCGYNDQPHVVIDEFRGSIGISHILRWLDRYPVSVETKGGSVPLKATKIFITSNLDPRRWYPELDGDTLDALIRRLNITHFN